MEPTDSIQSLFQRHFLHKQKKTIQNFLWNYMSRQMVQAILSGKNKAGSITLPNFKLYQNAAVIKRVCYWHTDRQISGTEQCPVLNPCIHGQLIFYSPQEDIMGKIISSINGFGKTRYPDAKNEIESLSYTTDKNQLKMDQLKTFRVRPKAINSQKKTQGNSSLTLV